MKIKVKEAAKIVKQFGIDLYSLYNINESSGSAKLPKLVTVYLENKDNIEQLIYVKSKKSNDLSYILEKIGNSYYLSRKIVLITGEVSISTILLNNSQISFIKNINKPKASEIVSLGDGLNVEGTFGL